MEMPLSISDRTAVAGDSFDADLLIIGGGMVGMAMARAAETGGLSSVVIDAMPPPAQVDPGFDGRCSAIAHASRQLLAAIGVWPRLAAAEPILEIRVSDGAAPLFLHFDHHEIGDEPFGYMVENRHLRMALQESLGGSEAVRIIAPARVREVIRDRQGASAVLSSGETIRARLVIGADGRGSPLRRALGIRTLEWSYKQTGIVVTAAHERPHRGIAHERFLPPGPFAILPIGGHRSSLVWTETADRAPALLALAKPAFDRQLARRFGDFLGAVESQGRRWSFPLGLMLAEDYIAPRMVLIGDAAHGIHPIAGQGLNLGLRDVAALTECLVGRARLGLDMGSAGNLAAYQRWRRADVVSLAAVTDGLNRLFSNDLAPLRLARDRGLAAVNRIGPLKRFFMRHARGTVGHLPRLLKGEPV